jgi:hypothetical protein
LSLLLHGHILLLVCLLLSQIMLLLVHHLPVGLVVSF